MTGSEASHRLAIPAKLNVAALAILAGALSAHLWPDWTHDPDLSHGLLMPAACVLLVALARGTSRGAALAPARALLATAVLGAGAVAVLWVAGILAVTLDWSSPVVDFALASSLALLGCAGVAAFADRGVGAVPFGWPCLAAALLWPLCSPPPPGTYQRLTLGLQLGVTTAVMRALDLLGVAARREGNVIELARGSVGIEEACSGVRSLISCVFAGILLSAALVRRPRARLAVIALAAPLAVAMNFLRSLALTLLVNSGARVEGTLHDATGYAVLVLTAAILVWLAVALDRGAAPETEPGTEAGPSPGAVRSQQALGAALAAVLLTLAFFWANTRRTPQAPARVPDLMAILPAAAPGWRVVTTNDLYRFEGTLRTDHLAQRSYLRYDGAQVTLYVAYWSEGQASVGLVGSHTPDACWPGSGWMAEEVPDPVATLSVAGRTLPAAQHRLFLNAGYPQHVWFWQLYGGRPISVGEVRSVPALLRLVVRYGFREGDRQAFVRISSNRPWGDIRAEPFVVSFFDHARALGLY